MREITKLKKTNRGTIAGLRHGQQIEGIKFKEYDPCTSRCRDECAGNCDFWTQDAIAAWGPSSNIINTWVVC